MDGSLGLDGTDVDGESILSEVNHQPESRMREIRQSGSEGGGAEQSALPTPIHRAPLRGWLRRTE